MHREQQMDQPVTFSESDYSSIREQVNVFQEEIQR